MRGKQVTDLHAVLGLLLEKCVILGGNKKVCKEYSHALREDQLDQIYNDATEELIRIFQDEFGIQAETPGLVDKKAADVLNDLLNEWGMLEQADKCQRCIVSGMVRREDSLPVHGAKVRAFHGTGLRCILLGESSTDAQGCYTIDYFSLPNGSVIDIRLDVTDKKGTRLYSSDIINHATSVETVDIAIPVDTPPLDQIIYGQVLMENDLPAERIKLRLYQCDVGGGRTLIEETVTLPGGYYAFPGLSELANAVVIIFAVTREGDAEIFLTKPLTNLSTTDLLIELKLTVPNYLQEVPAEFTLLIDALTNFLSCPHPHLVYLQENEEQPDITILSRATGWDKQLITHAVEAEHLRQEIKDISNLEFPNMVFYALLRAGLSFDNILSAKVDIGVFIETLKKMRDKGIIDISKEEIAESKMQFTTYRRLQLGNNGT